MEVVPLRESDNVCDYVQLTRIKCQVSVQANQSSKHKKNISRVPIPILVILHHHW